jgi:hypothetical protein
VCYQHSLTVGGYLGLVTNQLNNKQLKQRLREVYEGRLTIRKLKTEPDTYKWFRRANRPPRPSDALRPYKLLPITPLPFDYCQEEILKSFDDTRISERWYRDGTVNTDLFSWWFDTTVSEIALTEFDIYWYHL